LNATVAFSKQQMTEMRASRYRGQMTKSGVPEPWFIVPTKTSRSSYDASKKASGQHLTRASTKFAISSLTHGEALEVIADHLYRRQEAVDPQIRQVGTHVALRPGHQSLDKLEGFGNPSVGVDL
jgi:hypothetical protein